MYLSSNERIIRAKKGTGGIHLMKTVQALILSSYADPITPEQCAVVTEKLGDYLIEKGFWVESCLVGLQFCKKKKEEKETFLTWTLTDFSDMHLK